MKNLTNEIAQSATNFTAGTYAVTDTIKLTSNLVIPDDVTLIFQGGKFEVAEGCEENITITGSHTCLVAPITTIFGENITVNGTWSIDRAYPQWFASENVSDWSLPINKAIKMKGAGEVFLRNGIYGVKSPIYMNKGIQLIGENIQSMNDNYQDDKLCTRIMPIGRSVGEVFGDNNNPNYMLYINTEPADINVETKDSAYSPYIDQATMVKNIRFVNMQKKGNSYYYTNQKMRVSERWCDI